MVKIMESVELTQEIKYWIVEIDGKEYTVEKIHYIQQGWVETNIYDKDGNEPDPETCGRIRKLVGL